MPLPGLMQTLPDNREPYDVYTVVPGAIGNVLERHTVKPSTDSTSGSRYYQYNHRGDVIMATDSTGAMLWAQDYTAFGHIATDDHATGGANGVNDDLLITGKDWDDELGLYYFNARWYDPDTGRFLTETPLQPWVEGAYVYCHDNPIGWVDINGLEPVTIIIGDPANVRNYQNKADWLKGKMDIPNAPTRLVRNPGEFWKFIDEMGALPDGQRLVALPFIGHGRPGVWSVGPGKDDIIDFNKLTPGELCRLKSAFNSTGPRTIDSYSCQFLADTRHTPFWEWVANWYASYPNDMQSVANKLGVTIRGAKGDTTYIPNGGNIIPGMKREDETTITPKY